MIQVESSHTPFTPRNVVVLSDGTGNSAAKLFKTNVWRVYDALDLNCGDQVARYDDGVGTASFKPLALLGGAFGYGLKRNVLDLYTFLCRNVRLDPENPRNHDRIFAFGFSRGAFTARVVTALVAHQGLVQATDDAQLQRYAVWAYREYRSKRYRNSLGVRMLRSLRDRMLRFVEILLRQRAYDPKRNVFVDIQFVGVWDTVAAYGLPIQELTRGWDRWIWPMLPVDSELSPRVKRACHVMALDDERETFFPLLWNEQKETRNATSTNVSDERISQVWFSGVHSNVGGGYPDDSLAHTSLRWIASHAARSGLRFIPSECSPVSPGAEMIPRAWIERAVACAPMNDSRRGVGAYPRYRPRPVHRLCHDPIAGVQIVRPKVHESVFQRLRDSLDGYATIVLPERYAVVTVDGDILHGDAAAGGGRARCNPYEHSTQASVRRTRQERALDVVWARRITYFLTVGATLAVLILPIWPWTVTLLAGEHHFLGAAVTMLASFLPNVMSGWLKYYEENPAQLLVGAIAVGSFLMLSTKLEQKIVARMRQAWDEGGLVAVKVALMPPPSGWVYRLRTSAFYTGLMRAFSRTIWPNLFGVAMLVSLFVAGGVLILRLWFEVESRGNPLPASSCAGSAIHADGDPAAFAFWPSLMCNATGMTVKRGDTVQVEMALPDICIDEKETDPEKRRTGPWADATQPVGAWPGFTFADALKSRGFGAALPFLIAQPLRRVLHADWFVPVAVIGKGIPERHLLTTDARSFTAGRDGEVTLFVNDVIVKYPDWDRLYKNNAGGPARVRMTKVARPGAVGAPLAPYSCDTQRALKPGA